MNEFNSSVGNNIAAPRRSANCDSPATQGTGFTKHGKNPSKPEGLSGSVLINSTPSCEVAPSAAGGGKKTPIFQVPPKIPADVIARIGACPKAGNGVHNWIFRAARLLHPRFPNKNELIRVLADATARCGRDLPLNEIESAVINSQRNPGAKFRARKPRPKPNAAKIAEVLTSGVTVAQLRESSPMRVEEANAHIEEIIDLLFPGNPLLCVEKSKKFFDTRPREEWRGKLANRQFIVPSPMSARVGKRKGDQKLTKRSLDNTGPRRFVVVEFDPTKWELLSESERERFQSEEHYYTVKRDEQARVIVHLSKFAPVTMVLDTAGKSLHAWHLCAGAPESQIEKFLRYAFSLGADPATGTRCQFVRLPGGLRDNGKRQSIVYFNPQSLEGK